MLNKEEIWMPIKNWENYYEISNLGRVRSIPYWSNIKNRYYGGKILKSIIRSNGYLVVNLKHKDYREQVLIHREVLKAFMGVPSKDVQSCHNDGNRANNNLENLRWDTASNNHADKIKHGTHQYGELIGTSKLVWEEVNQIRRLAKNSFVKTKSIPKEFGISRTQMYRILRNDSWSVNQNQEQG